MKQIIYKNTAISYSDIGTGTAVVLLHGFLENKTMWKDLAPKLAEKNRVISIDLLGHGDSDCLGYVHSMEENAEIVKAVFEEATLTLPESSFMQSGGKKGIHTEHMGFVLAEMQSLQRSYPGAEW